MSKQIDTILDNISKLSIEEQEMLDEIIHKRIIEEKRDQIYNHYQESLTEYKSGNIKTGTIDELLNEIEKW